MLKTRIAMNRSTNFRSSLVIAGLGATLLLAGCGGDDSNGPSSRTLSGTPATLGSGAATAYTKVDSSGQPVAYGVRISSAALDAPGAEGETMVPLPATDGLVKYVIVDWNPNGHPPAGIYTLPHFDVHFYLIDDATREAIPGGPDPVATKAPAAGFLAADYVLDPTSVPAMGTHAEDTTSGEFNGKTFDKTYIYGYYDGTIAFYEPMMTQAYLQSAPNATQALKLPEKVALAGRYPQTMTVKTMANGDRVIELTAMKSMPASQ